MDIEKAFDSVQRKVLEWAMREKGAPEILARSVMHLYMGANWILSCLRSLNLKCGCTKDLCSHPFFLH